MNEKDYLVGFCLGLGLAVIGLIVAWIAKPPARERSATELQAIGRAQRQAMWALLAGFTNFIPVVNVFLLIPVSIFQVVTVYRLSKALQAPHTWLRVLLCLAPIINLLNLYVLTNEASKILRAKGVKIGVMGATPAALANLR